MSENRHIDDSTAVTDPARTRDPRAWVAPLFSTLVTLPTGLVALFFGGLSPMACDSCDGAVADGFHDSFMTAWTVLCIGLVLALIVLIATWAIPHQLRYAARRVGWRSPPPPSSGSLS